MRSLKGWKFLPPCTRPSYFSTNHQPLTNNLHQLDSRPFGIWTPSSIVKSQFAICWRTGITDFKWHCIVTNYIRWTLLQLNCCSICSIVRNRDCPVLQKVLLARLSRYWINSVVEFFSIVQIQYYVWQPKLARLSRYWIGARPMWKQQVIPWYQCPSQYRRTISVPNFYLTIFSWEILSYPFISTAGALVVITV